MSSSDDRVRYLQSARERVSQMSPSAKAELDYRYNRAGQESIRRNAGPESGYAHEPKGA